MLARHEPGYERDPTKKIQLLTHLGGAQERARAGAGGPYLADMDEGVRYAAVEALLAQGDEASRASRCSTLFVSDRRRACACASASPRASPSSAGRSATSAAEVEKHLPDAFQHRGARQGATSRIKKKPGAKE